MNANLSNATNKNAYINVNYTGTDDKGAAVSGSFTLSNAEHWSRSVELPRGGTYSFTYEEDGTNVTDVTPDLTEDVTNTTTIHLDATTVPLKTYVYTFTVPEEERPIKGSIDVICNGVSKTAYSENDWTVTFDVVEEEEVEYSEAIDYKFVTDVTFDPETVEEASEDKTIYIHPTVADLTMDVPVTLTWNVPDPKAEEVTKVIVTFTPDKTGVKTQTLELTGGETMTWSGTKQLPRLDEEGELITWTVSAAAEPTNGSASISTPTPTQISDGGSVSLTGEVARGMTLIFRIKEGSTVNLNKLFKTNNGGTAHYGDIDTVEHGTQTGYKEYTYENLDVKDAAGEYLYYGMWYYTKLKATSNATTGGLGNCWNPDIWVKAQAGTVVIEVEQNSEDVYTKDLSLNSANPSVANSLMPRKALLSASRIGGILGATTPTPSTQKTFYDPDITTTGDLSFTAIKFKDLPEGATPVETLPSTATGSVKEGSSATVNGGTAVITDGGSVKWSGLPQLDENGNPIYYYVVEKDATAKADTMTVAYSYEYVDESDTSKGIKKVTITNATTGVPEPQTTEIEVTKIWHDDQGNNKIWPEEASSITVTLSRKKESEADDTFEDVDITFGSDGITSTLPAGITGEVLKDAEHPENGYTLKLAGLEKSYDDGNDKKDYVYEFVEKQVSMYNTFYANSDGEVIVDGTAAVSGGKIINKPVNSVALPATGGPGTFPFHFFGILLLILAGLLDIKRHMGSFP